MNRIGGKSNTGEGGEDPARYRNELKGIKITRGTKLTDVFGKNVEVRLRAGGDSLRPRSSRSPRAASVSRPSTWSRPTRSRSRWRKAPSRARAASCPAARCPTISASCATRCPAWASSARRRTTTSTPSRTWPSWIHDLKNVSGQGRHQVKLVSEVGVGTVALAWPRPRPTHRDRWPRRRHGRFALVVHQALRHALGAGPRRTQQTLVLNRLRGRIRVQADGQMKTGRDVVIGALLGQMSSASPPHRWWPRAAS